MLTKRIIPCLDVTDGRVKKGVNFVNLVDVGDPVAIARRYQEQGADELVFLDITATNQGRQAGEPSPPASRRLPGPSRSVPWARGSSWSLRWTRTAPRMVTTPPFTRN